MVLPPASGVTRDALATAGAAAATVRGVPDGNATVAGAVVVTFSGGPGRTGACGV